MKNHRYIFTLVKTLIIEFLNLKLAIFLKNLKRLKYKNVFAKAYTSNWSEEIFVIKKLKTLFRGHMLLMILMEKNLLY